MARVGTLLDDYGRPADRVQIIRWLVLQAWTSRRWDTRPQRRR